VQNTMKLNCSYQQSSWVVDVTILYAHDNYYDVVANRYGSRFHMMVGTHAYGTFLCVPRLGISCELAHLTDTFWNTESIGQYFNAYDTATIVTVISHLPI